MGQINLHDLKDTVKTILENANSTTALPVDLSYGLQDSKRIEKVLTVNVEKIPIQPSFYPCITIFIDNKKSENTSMAKDSPTAKRKATIDMKVVGLIWEDNVTDNLVDQTDNDIGHLMENIEEILRSNPTLNGKVLNSVPRSTTYYNVPEETTNFRVGIIDLELTKYY